ncbi:hypothetical protein PoB_006298700 [Plakobranchus ocellatus]|uniref:Uncharacterized protein n=1 Tax=Plakobranchus ocellatus TaxID=259542 RepID=A0AAV4CX49_9GAST|nr:hypothetical protein PoB_006298700 [Plakobranchus ocellatus]
MGKRKGGKHGDYKSHHGSNQTVPRIKYCPKRAFLLSIPVSNLTAVSREVISCGSLHGPLPHGCSKHGMRKILDHDGGVIIIKEESTPNETYIF